MINISYHIISPNYYFIIYMLLVLQNSLFKNISIQVDTSTPPQQAAIVFAVSQARFKSEEYTAEILDSLESRSATLKEKKKMPILEKRDTTYIMNKSYHTHLRCLLSPNFIQINIKMPLRKHE